MVCGWLQGIEKKWLTGAFCLQESNGLRSADSTGFRRTARREPIKGQARKNRAEATHTLYHIGTHCQMITCKWFVCLGIGACSLPLVPWGMAMTAPDRSAEGGEVEVHGDRVTFGRKNLDGGGVGDEGIGGEIEFERCTCQGARTVATAPRVRPAVRVGGEDLLVIKDLDLEVSPEITGPRDESRRCIGARACGRSKKCAIRRGKLDFDEDFDQLFLPEMIEAGLLSAVAADAVLGELSELREW